MKHVSSSLPDGRQVARNELEPAPSMTKGESVKGEYIRIDEG